MGMQDPKVKGQGRALGNGEDFENGHNFKYILTLFEGCKKFACLCNKLKLD